LLAANWRLRRSANTLRHERLEGISLCNGALHVSPTQAITPPEPSVWTEPSIGYCRAFAPLTFAAFEIRNVVTTAEGANVTSGKTMTIGSPALLAIENASDDSVGVMSCQTTHQRHGILGGAYRRRTAAWQVSIDFAERATALA
jgi:hypothetical protein